MDISNAILVSKFLRTCRLVLGIAFVAVCAAGFIVGVGSGWWLSLVGVAVAFAVVSYPHRVPLLAFASLLILATIVLGASCLWWVFRILLSDFTLGIMLPFGGILLGFYWFWRMRRPTAKKYEDPLVQEPFALLPSFIDIWLSGGWHSWLMYFIVLMGSFMVGIPPTDNQILACFLLSLALLCSIAVTLFFVPAAKALVDGFALALICMIDRNRTENSTQSYFLFLLRNIVRNRRATGWLLRAPLFVVGILLVSIIIQSFTGPISSVGFSASAAELAALMICWRRASQFALMGAAKKIDLRTENFILFLRSFMDDDVCLERDSFIFRLLSLIFLAPGGWQFNDSPDRNPRLKRFEELIAEVVWPFGKLVALGRPGDKLPQTGAIRVETDPVGWQGTVERLISGARHGLIAVGISKGLKWEFQQFESEMRRMKLSLVLLPERGSLVADWRVFAAQYPKMLAYPEHELQQSLAARFDQTGSPIFIRGREKSAEAYRIAINTCLLPTEQFLQLAGRPSPSLLTLPAAA